MIRMMSYSIALACLAGAWVLATPVRAETGAKPVLAHYADMAHAKFEDALSAARRLDQAIDTLIAAPDEASLAGAREAWRQARIPYLRTEAYRFGNPVVDEWEGRVNSWPLDEGLIDYVGDAYGTESDENAFYVANVIANPKLEIGGKVIDAGAITPELLRDGLQGAGEVEANVATGYHAIEFLLWGQDLNGTGPGAGNRPATDFSLAACTHGHCDRRAAYLKAASRLLVSDLAEMEQAWRPEGAAARHVTTDEARGLSAVLTGLGSLSYGELAGERMNLGLLLHDPEEEQDCFSDNTFRSHYHDALGISDVYLGTYRRIDGTEMKGPSLADLVAETDPALDKEMRTKLSATMAAMTALAERGERVEAYDQMIAEGNKAGNAVVKAAIDRLVDQTGTIERIIASLKIGKIELEGSHSLDNPGAVVQ